MCTIGSVRDADKRELFYDGEIYLMRRDQATRHLLKIH
jgi:hypothetical protein